MLRLSPQISAYEPAMPPPNLPLRPLFSPADFRLPAGVAHVCAGGETAFLKTP
jgi:hypothetical protein